MKAEIGLDERNPACFLHSYSVVMVLRKVTVATPDTSVEQWRDRFQLRRRSAFI